MRWRALAALLWAGCLLPRGAAAEFQVNTYTSDQQVDPAVAAISDGGFVVVWESFKPGLYSYDGQDGSRSGIFAQRYSSNGMSLGSEFQVNTFTQESQNNPVVAGDGSGGFMVVWEDYYGFLKGQRFDSYGFAAGLEFEVSPTTSYPQSHPAIASNSSGFVVVWDGYGTDVDVFGQRLDTAGNQIGTEFVVNTYVNKVEEAPAVSTLADGGFVVVWSSRGGGYYGGPDGHDGDEGGVFGQRFDNTGAPAGTEFQVNTYTVGYQGEPSVATDGGAGFVVAWSSLGATFDYQDGDQFGVFAQRFDSLGQTAGSEFQVNTATTGNQDTPVVTTDANGFIVVWANTRDGSFTGDHDGEGSGVFGQSFTSLGQRRGGEFQVNAYTTRGQTNPAAAALPGGGYVVAWQSDTQDHSDNGIFGQRQATLGGCPTTPLPLCETTTNNLLVLKDKNGKKQDKILWKFLRGDIAVGEMGDPVGAQTAYRLCLYDHSGGTPRLAMGTGIPSDGNWQPHGASSFKYKKKGGNVDGIANVILGTGSPGRGKVLLKGGGINLPVATPLGATFFAVDTQVLAQFSRTDTSACWQSAFTLANTKTNNSTTFKAVAP